MVSVVVPRRDQIAAMVGNDPELIRLVEQLFNVSGTTTPRQIETIEQAILDNADDIEQNQVDISFNADDIAEIFEAIGGIQSQGLVFVASLSDLPDAVAGVITLEAGKTYLFIGDVDLLGNRLECAGTVAIVGGSPETSVVRSTGLDPLVPLLSSGFSLPLRDIAFTAGTVLNLDGTGNPSAALDWSAVNFVDCDNVGLIKNYTNFIGFLLGFLNSSNLVFDGTFGTVGFSDTIFVGTGSGVSVSIPATATIQRRFRVRYSAFVAFGSETALDVSLSATLPVEGYVLDHCNFSGGGTYASGVQADSDNALFSDNVGILNSANVAYYTMIGNTAPTTFTATNTPTKVLGTTTPKPSSQGFDLTVSNAAEYTRKVERTFMASGIVTFSGGNFVSISFYFALNGVVMPDTKQTGTSGNAGRVSNVPFQGVVVLQEGDTLEVWVENETLATDITVENLTVVLSAI